MQRGRENDEGRRGSQYQRLQASEALVRTLGFIPREYWVVSKNETRSELKFSKDHSACSGGAEVGF